MKRLSDVQIEHSLLDQLRDEDGVEGARGLSEQQQLALYRESLRRDVESLLNTRRRFLTIAGRFPLAGKSFLSYGVPDFSNEGYSTKEYREKLRGEIEGVLLTHESRLTSVHVEVMESQETEGGVLRFRISAFSRIATEKEPVTFNTAVEPADWSVKVEEGR